MEALLERHAWVYPGPPADGAQAAYRQHRYHGLRVQYLTFQPDGTLAVTSEAEYGENGYSAPNAADVRRHCEEAWITVSGTHQRGMVRLLADGADGARLRAAATRAMTDLAVRSDFTGVELDVEQYGRFSASEFAAYVRWTAELAEALHRGRRRLAIVVPVGRFPHWHNAAFGDAHPCDQVCYMVYDHQYDHPGQAVAPFAFIERAVAQALADLGGAAHRKLVVGLPAYSYGCKELSERERASGDVDPDVRVLTFRQVLREAARDDVGFLKRSPVDAASGEHVLRHNGHIYYIATADTVAAKINVARQAGARRIALWHLGGGNPC